MTTYYIFSNFIDRIVDFFSHWYAGGFRVWSHGTVYLMEALDRRLAFKVTIKYLFHPLYQDRSFIGYSLGFIFRSGRIIIGAIIYALVIAVSIGLYLIWVAAPLYAIFRIFTGIK